MSKIFWLATQSVIQEKKKLASTGNMLEMQNPRPHPKPTESESTF